MADIPKINALLMLRALLALALAKFSPKFYLKNSLLLFQLPNFSKHSLNLPFFLSNLSLFLSNLSLFVHLVKSEEELV